MSRRSGVRPRFGAAALAGVALVGTLVLAACGPGSPGSPTPSGSVTPAGSATPAASVDGTALAAAFVRILADPALHAGVVQQATATASQAGDILDLRVSMSGTLALPDVDLELAIEAEGQATRFRLVVVGDRAYVDLGDGWVEAPPGSIDTTELTTALVVVSDPDDLAYAGTQIVDGRTLYHLVSTRPLPYVPAGFDATAPGTGTLNDLDAYVEVDGTPVRIELSFSATGTNEAGPITMNGTTEIRFSNVDGGQVVVPPSLAPTAAP